MQLSINGTIETSNASTIAELVQELELDFNSLVLSTINKYFDRDNGQQQLFVKEMTWNC